jgi:hypothetical protein
MLAIIIPYYKHTFFEATLLSLAEQTCKEFKVYIGDDASPEHPTALLAKFDGRFDFEYHRFETNLGGTSLTQQWERCIDLSGNEDWIMILGDDDVLGENVVEEFYFNFNNFKSKTNVVRFASQMTYEREKINSKIFTNPSWEKATDSYFRKYKGLSRSSLSEYVFLKSAYLKLGFCDYSLGWHSDDKAWLDFSGDKMIYSINESVVFIRISNSSISGKNDNHHLKKIATLQFFENIIASNLRLFSKPQRLELLYGYELVIKRIRKINTKEWFVLSLKYFENFNFLVLIKFARRIFKSVFNL